MEPVLIQSQRQIPLLMELKKQLLLMETTLDKNKLWQMAMKANTEVTITTTEEMEMTTIIRVVIIMTSHPIIVIKIITT
jgi:hypothetical protein